LVVNLNDKTVGELSEIIHGKKLSQLTVVNADTCWYEVLKPIMLDLRDKKKAALSLPISVVLN